MEKFQKFCVGFKVVVVEIVSLASFLGIVGVGVYVEWHKLVEFLK